MLQEHFPEPVNAMVPVPVAQDCNLEENFHQVLQLFIQRTLQAVHLHAAWGRLCLPKTMMQAPINHLQRFKKMIFPAVSRGLNRVTLLNSDNIKAVVNR